MITVEQVRAARGWLKWSQGELATASNLSPNTIHNLEKGECVSLNRFLEVQRVLEKEGFEFKDNYSLRRRRDEFRTYEGPNSASEFYEDIFSSVRIFGGEIGVVIKNPAYLLRSLAVNDAAHQDQLKSLTMLAAMRAIFWEGSNSSPRLETVRSVETSRPPYAPMFIYLYANKSAVVMCNGREFLFQVITSMSANLKNWEDFNSCWDRSQQSIDARPFK